ncbi:glycoside hydrolase family 15 protein [Solwaraspora sp. WMMA2080]|uniref:glycoside hydrolase family 15 protein n=1 Tax=Solwaraspora sp. WMMA2080 TaxID=3015165 RepID=UPI00248B13E1|nr:glycoside hydrolase family 15 protein [Solwaraspora sp. WMMA2080]WBC18911.1 glycoside hydrolase family 15 protein [Solwaraspora sp. WMMA2080]
MPDIASYGLLSDCQGAALLSADGSVDWWCPARFDAPSVFARLLDPDAGHWSISPVDGHRTARRYLADTMVLQTDFRTADGELRLTDALALGPGERGHRIGDASPHVLLRRVEVLTGTVQVDVDLVVRPEYGRVVPVVTGDDGRIELVGGSDRLILTGDPLPAELSVGVDRITGRLTLTAGQTVRFALRHLRAGDTAPPADDQRYTVDDTVAGWRSWADEHHSYQGLYQEQVRRSALVLQALTYQPTGAVVAAPTSSLPEEVGGGANWDYRYAWLRDGAFTMQALWVAACPDEAHRFFDWIADSVGELPTDQPVPIMFGVGGERDLTEHDLEHLRGYRGSTPVRVGNDAWRQRQLDVLGEVMHGAWILRDRLGDLATGTVHLLRGLADRACRTWSQPDSGIWEGREGERHYLTSKLMCWVALDRAIGLAPTLHAERDVDRWHRTREQIRTAILDEGWSDRRQAFTGAFGSDHLDAGVLIMPIMGFLPGTDHRVVATIDAIEADLTHDGLVQRWTGGEDEGAFLICSYWLAEALALAGRRDRARQVFDAATGCANDLGLLAEEVDRRDGTLIGNFTQGLSHIGLINAAWTLSRTGEASQPPGPPVG